MKIVYELGDIAIVTTKKGRKFLAVYTLAPGIDTYWRPIWKPEILESALADPEVSIEYIGKED